VLASEPRVGRYASGGDALSHFDSYADAAVKSNALRGREHATAHCRIGWLPDCARAFYSRKHES
jgi:hypothetical protein